MEFKDFTGIIISSSVWNSINRIRLEFKAENETKKTSVFVVLIESDWNLKVIAEINETEGTEY